MLRKIGNQVKPSQEIKFENNKWEINTTSTFKNTHIEFEEGVEFEETTVDGRNVKVKLSAPAKRGILCHTSSEQMHGMEGGVLL